ncbi:MAG TPA: Ger(x)C family spore germination protein [Desulfitobacteriaceae bacterium]|nr:Ger(x)C family spore germination protein [Desulfitobacteriaceae bacterium]
MAKKLSKILLISLCFLLLTGCWDYKDLEDRTLVTAIGVDYDNGFYTLLQEIIQVRKHQEGDQKQSAAQNTIIKGQGEDLEEAEYQRDSSSPFPMFLGAVKVVILGQGLLQKGIEPYLNRINRLTDYRKTTLMVASRELPEEILQAKVKNEVSAGFMIEDTINQMREIGIGLYTTTGDIISSSASGEEGYLIPYIGLEGDTVQYLGLAVLKDYKLAGILDAKDSQAAVYLLAQKPKLKVSIPHPENENNLLSIVIRVKHRDFKADYIEGKVDLNINLVIDAELRYEYTFEPLEDEEIGNLEDSISRKMEEEILKVINDTQNKYQTDIFHFVRYFRAKNPGKYKEINWQDEYPLADIHVQVKTNLRDMNLFNPNAKKKY